jgi:outer membrane usher protein FimD/PapC
MKTKIVSLLLASGLLINAALAENTAEIGYASDYFYRGSQQSQEAVQAAIGFEQNVAGLNASLGLFTNQSIDSSADSYIVSAGVSKSFLDGLLGAYVGLNHVEDVPGAAFSEVQVSASIACLLSPTLSVYRDLDDSLYTFELSASHDIELGFADLGLEASVGNTDVSNADSRTYYSVGAGLSKGLSDSASASLSVDYVDADDIEREFVFATALTFQF